MRKGIALMSTLVMALTTTALAQTNENPEKSQDSLADSARKNRPKDMQIARKRVWTNDDLQATSNNESSSLMGTSQESASETLQKFRSLGKEELGTAILKLSDAPNVTFPERRNWEQRLFEAKQAWLDQVHRMVGHKDSSKDAQDEEVRLAQGARRNFERIANEGVQQARAVNDPVLKAHLQYQRQLDFCKQTTGELLEKCLASVEQLKRQMQREGIR